jgi:hypothetical protein
MTNAMPPHSRIEGDTAENSEAARLEVVEQRIRDLAASQVPIRDPDVIQERERPQWKKTLLTVFPGFS